MTKLAIVLCVVLYASAANATLRLFEDKPKIFSSLADSVLNVKDAKIKIFQNAFTHLKNQMDERSESMIQVINNRLSNTAVVPPVNAASPDETFMMKDWEAIEKLVESANGVDISGCIEGLEHVNTVNERPSPNASISTPCDIEELQKGYTLFTKVYDIITKAIGDLQGNRNEIARCRETSLGPLSAGICGAGPVTKASATAFLAKKSLVIPGLRLKLWLNAKGNKAIEACTNGSNSEAPAQAPVVHQTNQSVDSSLIAAQRCVERKIAMNNTVPARPIFNPPPETSNSKKESEESSNFPRS